VPAVYFILVISENGAPSVLLALQRATHHTLHALAGHLTALELAPSEINTLANLADGRERSVRELSADTGTRATTLTGVLDRLERRGYLTRRLDAADRRSFRIALTRTGRAAATRVREAIEAVEAAALASVSPRQVSGFHAVIGALSKEAR
jgi:MarR family transcriptional regulator, organic hydroperoxide resistance regulator